MATEPGLLQATMDTETLKAMLGIGLAMYEFWKRFVKVEKRHEELNDKMREVVNNVDDMNQEVKNQEAQPGKKRKKVVEAYFRQAEEYRKSAQSVLDSFQAEPWKLKRMRLVLSIDRHHREGQDLLTKGSQLREEGLTYNEVRMRGEMIPLEEDQYIGNTFSRLMDSSFRAMKDGEIRRMGIYGFPGARKTNLMKHLHNKVLKDEYFKAVYWATAPRPKTDQGSYNKALQQCVADGMWVDLDNNVVHDEVRSAGRILARLKEIGPGRAVVFLDNVEEEFLAYELLGIPSSSMIQESTDVNCILAFSTLSKDVCNRMQCDLILKMELLETEEAKDLFLHEVKHGDSDRLLSIQEQRIEAVAIKVANECAKMPIAITVIARSMVGIKDLHEWNNRLNEMMETIGSIHNEEDKILEQLKLGYICLKERTVQLCFLEAAKVLPNDSQVPKHRIIEEWKSRKLIGMDRPSEPTDDQGYAILNRLERVCLLQVAPDHQTVTMNKWIWKMATKISEDILF